MFTIISIGDTVRIADDKHPVNAVVEQVSTWRGEKGKIGGPDTCYYVRSIEWKPPHRWVSAGFVHPLTPTPETPRAE